MPKDTVEAMPQQTSPRPRHLTFVLTPQLIREERMRMVMCSKIPFEEKVRLFAQIGLGDAKTEVVESGVQKQDDNVRPPTTTAE
jgi:hypothetical protein